MSGLGSHSCWRGLLLALVLGASGCSAIVYRPEPRLVGPQTPPPPDGVCVPTEKDKSSLPPYTVEPPDILLIEAIRVVPKPPYHIQSGDELQIIAEPPEADLPAHGFFVDPQGRIDLGPRYGKVPVNGLTTDEATEAVKAAIAVVYRDPEVSLTLVQSTAMQPITGEHLVSPDGTVNLGTYGLVYVAGMTLAGGQAAVERASGRVSGQAAGVGLRVRLQQQGVLRDHPRRRPGRRGHALADHRQRDGARRHLADQRAESALEQEDLDRAADAQRGRLRRDPAGRLE